MERLTGAVKISITDLNPGSLKIPKPIWYQIRFSFFIGVPYAIKRKPQRDSGSTTIDTNFNLPELIFFVVDGFGGYSFIQEASE